MSAIFLGNVAHALQSIEYRYIKLELQLHTVAADADDATDTDTDAADTYDAMG